VTSLTAAVSIDVASIKPEVHNVSQRRAGGEPRARFDGNILKHFTTTGRAVSEIFSRTNKRACHDRYSASLSGAGMTILTPVTPTVTLMGHPITHKGRCLESRRLQFALILHIKFLLALALTNITSIFTLQSHQSTWGHGYKIHLP